VRLFFNIHPSEMNDDALIDSLRALKIGLHCDQQVVLEVHEAVVTDLPAMRRLREQLNALGIGLAYDDFGAGQARLTELAEVPPDFIKLDRCLIHGIETAAARQDLVRALNRVSSDLGAATIAEGIETQAEADVCLALHCRYGQGFLFGRPQPLVSLGTAQTVFSSGEGIK
jgi:EAL domain-containing protein (putative c-di-GMP-specific phosphodiesterase class I)